jgi:epoxyqueuosine reductase
MVNPDLIRYHMTVKDAAIKSRLVTRARQLGCAAVGVTDAGPVRDHSRFTDWLARGWAADMGYLAQHADKRADPRGLTDTARSVIVVAVPYPGPTHSVHGVAGRVAALFGGRDYHPVVRSILMDLAETLGLTDSTCRPFVDTGPVLERSLAVAAGLGAIGHHTQLLVPGAGARVTLGVLLTDHELEPDAPFTQDLCGDCRACLEACPTSALHKGKGLDARRCLSYWTTASRQPIPLALRPQVGNRLYGCDTCQECCPHDPQPNAASDAGSATPAHAELRGDRARDPDTLHRLLGLGRRPLARALAPSAMGWIGRTALLRTVCVVLGNHGHPDSTAPLAAALTDPDPIIRGHAAWGLGQLNTPEARAALEAAAASEPDPEVQQEIELALGRT